ncbi:hypothetical protein NDU88_007517 [Pleurodeles waltl]|uniref:Uncharacterized protein n=1 Tax=Pleurodeles waltl TaxID=8319 RepID=A0AAV7RUC1_PLEWA|nr:hypothetical protein NDU88_007517 [Pleurodeles waltl]
MSVYRKQGIRLGNPKPKGGASRAGKGSVAWMTLEQRGRRESAGQKARDLGSRESAERRRGTRGSREALERRCRTVEVGSHHQEDMGPMDAASREKEGTGPKRRTEVELQIPGADGVYPRAIHASYIPGRSWRHKTLHIPDKVQVTLDYLSHSPVSSRPDRPCWEGASCHRVAVRIPEVDQDPGQTSNTTPCPGETSECRCTGSQELLAESGPSRKGSVAKMTSEQSGRCKSEGKTTRDPWKMGAGGERMRDLGRSGAIRKKTCGCRKQGEGRHGT